MVSGLPLFQHGSPAEARSVPSQLVVAVPVMLLAALLPVPALMKRFRLVVPAGFRARYELLEPLPAVTAPEPVSLVQPEVLLLEVLLTALSIE